MTRTVAIALYPGCVALDVVGPHEVFSLAAALVYQQSGRLGYQVVRAAHRAGPVTTASGLALMAEHTWAQCHDIDTLIVPGFLTTPPTPNPGHTDDLLALAVRAPPQLAMTPWLQTQATRARRIAGVCTGAFHLAAAGLLDNKPATTHWRAAAHLSQRHPSIDVQPDSIYCHGGDGVWTSAGVTAGIDLSLALVAEDYGHALAQAISRELVVFLHRPGGQSQFSTWLRHPMAADEQISRVQRWVADHLDHDLSVAAMAKKAGMSPRNFSRKFRTQVGLTPAKWVERCRVEAARNMLEHGEEGLDVVALSAGFGSAEVMRRVFNRCCGVSPGAYRARFKEP